MPSIATGPIVDTMATLVAPSGRQVAVRLLAPARCVQCGLIVFSHGANASPARYDVLLRAWAEGGWVVAAPLHVDSEEHPERARYKPTDSLGLRLEDYDLVVATYGTGRLASYPDIELSGDVIAAGHSYGALIAQIAGGARLDGDYAPMVTKSPLPLAVVAISPPGPIPNYVSSAGWSHIAVPELVVSGTTDVLPGIASEWNLHMVSYTAAPAGRAYALVFESMDHYFNGAYGRLKATDAATDQAVRKLNAEVLRFAQAVRAHDPHMADEWIANSSPGVTATAR
ncbi:MAG: alpha/beta fold hydrolase [Pseudomonadales bacterium]|nr:alpha/beta fold hydrolase [Pseudomonadales bacterium]